MVSDNARFIYVNGKLMPDDLAVVSVFDSGFLSGDAIFEGVRLKNGKFFQLDEHINMLWESAKALSMDLEFLKQDVKEAIFETAKKNGFVEEGYLRVQISRGCMTKPFMNPTLAKGECSLVIYPDDSKENNGESTTRIITSGIRRLPPSGLDQKIHSCNKINSLLAKTQANLVGMDEALMLDMNGFIAECSAMNVFFVKDGLLLTPYAKSCKLGVTRQYILDNVGTLGINVFERDLSLYDAYNSNECFMCGTHSGLTPVTEIDGRQIGDGKIGETTRKIMNWYSSR
jgi:branched-chain amino acid aminotransferase